MSGNKIRSLCKKVKGSNFKSDEAIAAEFGGFTVNEISFFDSNSGEAIAGYIGVTFPEAGEHVAGGRDEVNDSFIIYNFSEWRQDPSIRPRIAFDNWYPEDVSQKLRDAILSEARSRFDVKGSGDVLSQVGKTLDGAKKIDLGTVDVQGRELISENYGKVGFIESSSTDLKSKLLPVEADAVARQIASVISGLTVDMEKYMSSSDKKILEEVGKDAADLRKELDLAKKELKKAPSESNKVKVADLEEKLSRATRNKKAGKVQASKKFRFATKTKASRKVKAFVGTDQPLSRAGVEKFQEGDYYGLRIIDTEEILLEPIYSWIDDVFNSVSLLVSVKDKEDNLLAVEFLPEEEETSVTAKRKVTSSEVVRFADFENWLKKDAVAEGSIPERATESEGFAFEHLDQMTFRAALEYLQNTGTYEDMGDPDDNPNWDKKIPVYEWDYKWQTSASDQSDINSFFEEG